jgi:hypothetical protein
MDRARAKRWAWAGLVLALGLVAAAVGVRQLWNDPKVIFLAPEGGAKWVRYPLPFGLYAWQPAVRTTHFRHRFQAGPRTTGAVLTVRMLSRGKLWLNGRPVGGADDPLKWKEPLRLDLSAALAEGANELLVEVVNENGPPALLAHCDALGIRSGPGWEAREGAGPWAAARDVDRIRPYSLSRTFPRADRALLALWPVLLPLFAFVFLWSMKGDGRSGRPSWARLSPGAVRWLLMGGWLVMGINNFGKIPVPFGMDFPGHVQYLAYVALSWRVPLATEGWQMFQPPLFYFLEAILFRLCLPLFDLETVVRILKLLPLACGALQVEVCYRALRYAFPGRDRPQVVGTLLGGLLPMNLYMSQSIGNEPMVGLFTALAILGVCRILSGAAGTDARCRETALVTGFVLGLALLTKPTPVLIVPPMALFLAAALYERGGGGRRAVLSAGRTILILFGAAFLTAGWYYLRNYMEIGRFFIGGWDASRKIVWWMDPGYRTAQQCIAFGEALLYPVYSAIFGFWDGLYSTLWLDGYLSSLVSGEHLPWNRTPMIAGALLSLLPTAAVALGAAAALPARCQGPERRIHRFSLACVILYLGAIFAVFLLAPILSSVKASYALGITPCLALLAARGFEVLSSRRIARAVVQGLFACWAAAAYGAYFVR